MKNQVDTSYYLDDTDKGTSHPMSRMADGRWSEITPLYTSSNGVTRLFTASRYGRKYVLKTLQERVEDDPFYRTLLQKEFEIGIGLDHVNIRRTIGFERVDGVGECIISEYVDGMPLSDALSRGLINASNVRSVCRQLAEALEYMHSKQVMHRDLKPANVLFTHGGGVVKLIDFSLSDGDSFVVIKNAGGTRSYIAPEQLVQGARATVEADMYSLGKIVGEMANATGDSELAALASRCIRENPGARPHSIAESQLTSLELWPQERLWDLGSGKLTRLLLTLAIILALSIIIIIFA